MTIRMVKPPYKKQGMVKRQKSWSYTNVVLFDNNILIYFIISTFFFTSIASQEYNAEKSTVQPRRTQFDSNTKTSPDSQTNQTSELKNDMALNGRLSSSPGNVRQDENQELGARSPQPSRGFFNFKNPSTSSPSTAATRQTRQTTAKRRLTTSAPETTTSGNTNTKALIEDLDDIITDAPISSKDRERERERKRKITVNKKKKKKPALDISHEPIDELDEDIEDEEEDDYKVPPKRKRKTTAKPELNAADQSTTSTSTSTTATGSSKQDLHSSSTKPSLLTTTSTNTNVSGYDALSSTTVSEPLVQQTTSLKTPTSLPMNVESLIQALNNSNKVPLVYPNNCCCNQSRINVTGLSEMLTNSNLVNNKTSLDELNQNTYSPVANRTVIVPLTSTASSLNPLILDNQRNYTSPISDNNGNKQDTNPLERSNPSKLKSGDTPDNKSIGEMMKNINEDHSKLQANFQDQANSLRRFIIMSSIGVVIATSIAVALIFFFLK